MKLFLKSFRERFCERSSEKRSLNPRPAALPFVYEAAAIPGLATGAQ